MRLVTFTKTTYHHKKERQSMNLDNNTIVSYPTLERWAEYYDKFRSPMASFLKRYSSSLADIEDAVEEAFHKLMHKKDPDAYGDNMPQTESEWFWRICWQARSYLSHLMEKGERHAKYVECASKVLGNMLSWGRQGESIDGDLRARSLVRALETLKSEQDISRRNLSIYVCRMAGGMSSKEVAKKYGLTANNVDQIVWRVGRLVRKHGPRHFAAALRREGYGCAG